MTPWVGVVLRANDPRAWADTIAFSGTPTIAEVDAHLKQLEDSGVRLNRVPVLWDFSRPEKEVRWERPDALVRPEDDLKRWMQARANAMAWESQKSGCPQVRALVEA
jgi:hypothetical protein